MLRESLPLERAQERIHSSLGVGGRRRLVLECFAPLIDDARAAEIERVVRVRIHRDRDRVALVP